MPVERLKYKSKTRHLYYYHPYYIPYHYDHNYNYHYNHNYEDQDFFHIWTDYDDFYYRPIKKYF